MRARNVIVALSILLSARGIAHGQAAAPPLYRIELKGNQTIWSEDKPRETASALLFHRYPGGVLMSLRRSDVVRIVVSAARPSAARVLAPGAEIVIGPTGAGREAPVSAARGLVSAGPSLPPGEAKDGTALLNPDRTYRPEWDGRHVPGLNLPYPNSSNDYREGRTFAFPPAPAVQTAPGAPPTMPQGTGEVPHKPQ